MVDMGDSREIAYEEFDSGEMFAISSQRIRKFYEKMWRQTRKDFGLTQNEIDVLLFLKSHPDVDTAANIASYCALSRSLVCKSVETLLEQGYLTSQTDKQDRRYLHLTLTDRAMQIIKELEERNKEFWNSLLDGISKEDRNFLLQILKQMRLNLKQMGVDITKH